MSRGEKRRILAARMSRVTRMLAPICKRHGVTRAEVLGRARTGIVSNARAELMVGLWKTGMPLAEIGRLLERDHTSVLYAVRRVLGPKRYAAEARLRRAAMTDDALARAKQDVLSHRRTA